MPRITSGKLKNKKFDCVEGLTTRPTLEKTRATILNSLASRFDLEDYTVIDLFAGTGAMAFEAHSWGAGEMILLEKDRAAFEQLQKNIAKLGLSDVARVFQKNAIGWLEDANFRKGPYLIFMDPPYRTFLGRDALQVLATKLEALQGSLIIIEHDPKSPIATPEGMELFLEKKQGAAKVDFFQVLS